ncbi:MAG: MinD/ParA family protein [Halodesulfurarchaeum sp.]
MIVTVCGGKGGVGKSTVALNLAYELDAVLVDADVGMADLPTDHGPTLHDVLGGHVDPIDAVRDDWAVGLLPSGRSLAGARSIDLRRFETTLETLSGTYRWVVVDTPAGFDAAAALPIATAAACVLVTTPDPAPLADAVRTRSLAREFDTGLAAVVLNRAAEKRDDVTAALGGPQVPVPPSRPLHDAQRHGLPIALAGGDEDVRAAFRALRGQLTRIERDTRLGGSQA